MKFREERGMGLCGLACVLCSDKDCPGCAAGIAGGGDCSAGKCAAGKGIDGCYACPDYTSCTESMPHGKRSRAFNRYAREFGKQALNDRLRVNYENGITYHRPDGLIGDYDALETEIEIYKLLRYGREGAVHGDETNIEITIKALSPEIMADYFDFFENRAFTDDTPYRCYCQVFQMTKEQYFAAYDDPEVQRNPGPASRQVAERQIADGVLRGYLAYADGKSIGWCNANDRANSPAEPYHDVPFHSPAEKREKAVVCFEIAPEYRGKGVAHCCPI